MWRLRKWRKTNAPAGNRTRIAVTSSESANQLTTAWSEEWKLGLNFWILFATEVFIIGTFKSSYLRRTRIFTWRSGFDSLSGSKFSKMMWQHWHWHHTILDPSLEHWSCKPGVESLKLRSPSPRRDLANCVCLTIIPVAIYLTPMTYHPPFERDVLGMIVRGSTPLYQ